MYNRQTFSNTLLILALAFLPVGSAANSKPKVVSLDLCTDWLLATYADPEQIIAMSPLLRKYPVAWISSDWPTHDGSLETILELNPDLVISGEFNAPQLRRRLQSLGIAVKVLILPRRLSAISEVEYQLQTSLGKPADKIITSRVENKAKQSPYTPRLLVLGANAVGTGRQTIENDIIEYAGWQNYLNVDGYVTLDLERLITDPPDAILWTTPPSKALANNFAMHKALRTIMPAERWLKTEYGRWHCHGPWTFDIVRQLQEQLQLWHANQH